MTEDGGHSWHDGGTEGLTSDAPRSVAFDPQEPRRVYAGSFTGGGLYKSEDHGKHWQHRKVGRPDLSVFGVTVDPVDHSVYATTLGGNGLWKSTDYGETFTRIDRAPGAPAGKYLGLSGRTVTIDPGNHAVVYLPDVGAVKGIWRSEDAGKSWSKVDATDSFISVTVDPTNSSIVYASSVNGPAGPAVLKSIDGGYSFSAKGAGLPTGFETANTGFLLVNPKQPNVLYVGFEYIGVFKSNDAGGVLAPDQSRARRLDHHRARDGSGGSQYAVRSHLVRIGLQDRDRRPLTVRAVAPVPPLRHSASKGGLQSLPHCIGWPRPPADANRHCLRCARHSMATVRTV